MPFTSNEKLELKNDDTTEVIEHGYMEVNLSQDLLLEISDGVLTMIFPKEQPHPDKSYLVSYSEFERCHISGLITENKEEFIRVSDRHFLMDCFQNGQKRVFCDFKRVRPDGTEAPQKMVFYLYSDSSSGDVFAFCVLYDMSALRRREKKLRDLEDELEINNMQSLISQIQPHFLYNTLFSIQEVVLDDPEYGAELIGDFALHLRSFVRAMSSGAPIPFERELANIKAYVNIEKMRFGPKLKVKYDIQTTDFSVLPLSVQPMVENAIRHGVYPSGEKGGTVTVRTQQTDSETVVSIEDDGVGFDANLFRTQPQVGQGDSAGLKNTIRRLETMMNATVDIRSAVGMGTVVTIRIPRGKA